MNSCPNEILILIFKHLHIEQKLECMLVCRAWGKILHYDGYLFETIQFSFPNLSKVAVQQLISLTKRATTESFPGQKCKRLLINIHQYSTIRFRSLATSFPNLSLFYSSLCTDSKAVRLGDITRNSDSFAGWRVSLETLVDNGTTGYEVINTLKTGTFNRLTTMVLKSKIYYDQQFSSELIGLLQNTPVLNDLSIGIRDCTFIHLEDIHRNAPELTSLTLFCTVSSARNNNFPLGIVPAKKIEALVLSSRTWENRDMLSQYIILKYTRLKEFTYGSNVGAALAEYSNVFSNSKFAEFINSIGPRLTKCMVSFKEISVEIVELFVKNMIKLETLGTDTLGYKKIDDIDRAAQNRGLVAYNNHLLVLEPIVFKSFPRLKELVLVFSSTGNRSRDSYGSILGTILEKLPKTVQTLYLKSLMITLDQETDTIQNITNVVNLELHCEILYGEKLSLFLSQHFPKLKTLVLRSDIIVKFDAIELPEYHLHCVEVIPHFRHRYIKSNITHFKVIISGQTFHYKIPENSQRFNPPLVAMDKHDSSVQRVLKASPDSSNSSNGHVFQLKCADVKKVYCYNYLLLL